MNISPTNPKAGQVRRGRNILTGDGPLALSPPEAEAVAGSFIAKSYLPEPTSGGDGCAFHLSTAADELQRFASQRQPILARSRIDHQPFLHHTPGRRLKASPGARRDERINAILRQLHDESAFGRDHRENLVADAESRRAKALLGSADGHVPA